MGLCIQSVVGVATNPGAAFTAVTAATGDSLNPANFTMGTQGFLDHIVRRGATKGAARVTSPKLHDNVTGMTFYSDLTVTRFQMPPEIGQPVYPADVLTVSVTGGAAETDGVMLTYWYQDNPGVAAKLVQWADIAGLIRNIKPITVAVTTSATIGAWQDTVVTTTENQLHADSYYAVLGYQTDTVIGGIGFKSPETGNYRIAGPGTDLGEDTVDYFVAQAQMHGRPYIPFFAANNRAGAFVCTWDIAASTAANITLVLAELASAPHA